MKVVKEQLDVDCPWCGKNVTITPNVNWRKKSKEADRIIGELEEKIKKLELALGDLHDIEC